MLRRWSGRYDTKGIEGGVQDRQLGRASARAVPVDEALRMVTRIGDSVYELDRHTLP